MGKKELSDKTRNRISFMIVLVFGVALFLSLFFFTNLFNFNSEDVALIKQVDKGLDVKIPNAVVGDNGEVNTQENSENIVIPSIPDINPADMGDYDFIAYPGFADPYGTSISNDVLTISDRIIYNTGYYSVNGGTWTPYNLQGTPYSSGSPWIAYDASYDFPSALGVPGTHYVLVYSCSLVNNAWDCHGNKWQLNVVDGSNSECTPQCSGKVCGTDGCGGSCGSCSGSTPICSGGQCIANQNTGVAIIADHNAAMAFSSIPSSWIQEAKKFNMYYGHTSHGGQIMEGMGFLENANSNLNFRTVDSSPGRNNAELIIYDAWVYIDDWMSDEVEYSRYSSGNYDLSMFSWCGEQSENSVSDVNNYLSHMTYLQNNYPNTKFILMTGHTEDYAEAITTRNNNLVRAYAQQNGLPLLDFADLEKYDPSGNAYSGADDSCVWCKSWCNSNPSQCQNLPYCTHVTGDDGINDPAGGILCVQKAKAFWWMMARLAGWPG